jgi:hypothetical protein
MESHLFPYSLGEQQCPGSLRFNLPQIIRQQYRSMASPLHATARVLLDQVRAIGVTATRHLLFNEAARLQHTDQVTATDCAALVDRIDELVRPA